VSSTILVDVPIAADRADDVAEHHVAARPSDPLRDHAGDRPASLGDDDRFAGLGDLVQELEAPGAKRRRTRFMVVS
jgi:hypothetical protein